MLLAENLLRLRLNFAANYTIISFICLEFVWNIFMSGICPVLFVQNLSRIFSCPEYVQKKFLEFFMSRICPDFLYVRNMSGKFFWDFFHVQNLSSFLGMKKFRTSNLIIFLNIFWTFSGYEK